jgi:predicted RNase H-like HicB family nuclease
MKLSEYLKIPYILQASSIEKEDGRWVRRAEYPELPHCAAESYSIVEAIEAVEVLRVEILAKMLREGHTPPAPRPPLDSIDPTEELRRLGLTRSGQRRFGKW